MTAHHDHEIPCENRLDREFMEFHDNHPEVYDTLVSMSLESHRRGKRVGIGCLWEVMRWHLDVRTGEEPYQLNNNHRSRYARLIMATVPELDGFFSTRPLSSTPEEATSDYPERWCQP